MSPLRDSTRQPRAVEAPGSILRRGALSGYPPKIALSERSRVSREPGAVHAIRENALVIEQEKASILIDQLGTVRLVLPAERPHARIRLRLRERRDPRGCRALVCALPKVGPEPAGTSQPRSPWSASLPAAEIRPVRGAHGPAGRSRPGGRLEGGGLLGPLESSHS